MGVFVSDTFTGTAGTLLTAHTGEVGATWSVQPGSGGTFNYSLTGATSRARMVTVSDFGQLIASGVPTTADYVVRGSLILVSDLDESIQIQGRSSAAASTMYTAAWFRTDHKWHLFQVVGGSFTEIGGTGSSTPAPTVGVTQALELSMIASSIVFSIDSSVVIAATDTVITDKGFAGIGGGAQGTESDTTGFQWSDFTALDAVGTLPVAN